MIVGVAAVGGRFTYDGVEYVINRITPDRRRGSMQIDCMEVDEVSRRVVNLERLLEGRSDIGPDEWRRRAGT